MRRWNLFDERPIEYTPPSSCGFGFGVGEAALASTLLATTAEAGIAVAAPTVLSAAALSAAVAPAASGLGAALSVAGPVLGLGGTLLSAKSQLDAADYAAASERSNAAALKIRAGQDVAAAQRVQISRERQTTLALSQSQARAAASGGGATDPSVLAGEQNIAQQGEYNALSGLYEGQAQARADQLQADIDLFKARNYETAAPIAAGGTILSGLSAFAGSRLRARQIDQYGLFGAGG